MSKVDPNYYKDRPIEIIDCIESMIIDKTPNEAFLVGQVVKYVARYNQKNELEDLNKATWYLDRLKNKVEVRMLGL